MIVGLEVWASFATWAQERFTVGLAQLRRYEVQAHYGFILALLSVVPMLAAAVTVLRNYRHDIGQIVYGAQGRFVPVFVACVLLSLISAALGCVFGWSSAGQRRNHRPASSWVGFFVGGAVVTFDIILLLAFWMLRLQQGA